MGDTKTREIEYWHDGVRLLGHLCAPAEGGAGTALLLLPDAYGVTGHAIGLARRLAGTGRAVLVADLWGERRLPADQTEFGPLIKAMAADRRLWLGRVRAAHDALLAQPEAPAAPVAVLGYCFGGSSALELTRNGAALAGVVCVHGGLDVVDFDWSAAGPAPVLVIGGDKDPVGNAGLRSALTAAMTEADLDWQVHVYSRTVHAFTAPQAKDSPRPDIVAHNPRSTARAWAATLRFLREIDESRLGT